MGVVRYTEAGLGRRGVPRPPGRRDDLYRLLPDIATLNGAADTHTAVAVDGSVLLALKEYEKQRGARGLFISQADSLLAVYPVYGPRTAEKP